VSEIHVEKQLKNIRDAPIIAIGRLSDYRMFCR